MAEMVLKDTMKMMESEDYKERFKAEYFQLAIRLEKLRTMLEKWDSNELEFTPTCPRSMYDEQALAMSNYLDVLYDRAQLEGIELICK